MWHVAVALYNADLNCIEEYDLYEGSEHKAAHAFFEKEVAEGKAVYLYFVHANDVQIDAVSKKYREEYIKVKD